MSTLKTIGFIDSGIGGLNILNGALNSFDNLTAIYYGDNKNVPYGNKSQEELLSLLLNSINLVVNAGAGVVVIACGTLSTTFYNKLQKLCKTPIILTLPPKINLSIYKRATLIATPSTIRSRYVLENFKGVFKLPLPFLAREVESYIFQRQNIKLDCDLLGVPPYTDAVILGCTHYYYLKEQIEKSLGVPCLDAVNDVVDCLSKFINRNDGKPLTNSQKKVFFIGDSAEYNCKVYKNVLFGEANTTIIPSVFKL